MLSDELTRQGIEHVVLNAKPEHAQREGETIAQAGRVGAVTIATNMAGRGVDIKLGGDPEMMAKAELRKLGVTPEDESYEQELTELLPRFREQCEAEGEKVIEAAACSSAAPSATSRGASTTSSAAAPVDRETRASPASTSRPRTS